MLLRANLNSLKGEIKGLRSAKSSKTLGYPRPAGIFNHTIVDARLGSA